MTPEQIRMARSALGLPNGMKRSYRNRYTAAKGWISVRDALPALDDTVVCTDGKHRWLDMRMAGFENLIWQGHLATHWHAIDALPFPPEQSPDMTKDRKSKA